MSGYNESSYLGGIARIGTEAPLQRYSNETLIIRNGGG